MTIDLATLRRYAVARTLVSCEGPADAVARLGFVQYDPIRCPACAQDLILRHRIDGYRAGDLDRAYARHDLDEAFLHVYGVMPRVLAQRLHPRGPDGEWRVEREHPGLARRVLRHVRLRGETHPRALAQAIGEMTTTGGWGGETSATTRVLDMLQYRGALRVSRRDGGIRVYAPAGGRPRAESPARRANRLLHLLLALYAPLPVATLRHLAYLVRGRGLAGDERAGALVRFAKRDDVAHATVEGLRYLYPASEDPRGFETGGRVRALAPFDPIAWDRRRFEHLWGWGYRFEAYTPTAKRVYGYYALPLLWRDRVVGWLNATPAADGLAIAVGYATGKPRDAAFRRELDDEIDRLRAFARTAARRSPLTAAPPP